MEIYLVGGAVRDELLQRPIQEKDWVVVGATSAEMLRLGYRQVGKDFPVFLHPKTQEEYALARTERKIGRGYTAFEFDASPDVSLKEDLMRRDLTINAIAKNAQGEFIDPYHGREDLKNKLLRHVSPAFVEDPVRVLRVARFAARFAELGFRVAHETNLLMKQMVDNGEVDALVPERVWKEFERALGEKNPEQFFIVLDECTALNHLFPAIVISSPGIKALQRSVDLTLYSDVRFAVLLHDVTLSAIEKISEHYRIPNQFRELAMLVKKYFQRYADLARLTAEDVVKFFRELDVYRRRERAEKFLLACEAILQGNQLEKLFYDYLSAAEKIDAKKIATEFKGKEIAEQLDFARVKEIEKIII